MAKKIELNEVKPVKPVELDELANEPLDPKHAVDHRVKHWKIGRIFWGLLFVLIGLLILASNSGLVSLNWFNLWRLWPLFIIMIGMSILTIQGWAGRLLAVVIVVLALGAVTYALIYNPHDIRQTSIYNISSQKLDLATNAEVNVQTGLGQLDINSTDQTAVVQAKLESNISKLTSDAILTGTTQVTNINTDVTDNWAAGNVDNRLNLNVTRALPIRLNLNIGASNINADLTLARLQSLSIKSSATKSDIKLGNIEDLTTVNLDSGASSFVIRVPSTSGVSVKLSGLTSNNLEGLVKNGDTYESSNYGLATKKIDIVGRLGLASFKLEQY